MILYLAMLAVLLLIYGIGPGPTATHVTTQADDHR